MYPDGYTEAAVRGATEASLKRLGVDALDLTQLHCVPEAVLRRGEIFGWLRRLKRRGERSARSARAWRPTRKLSFAWSRRA